MMKTESIFLRRMFISYKVNYMQCYMMYQEWCLVLLTLHRLFVFEMIITELALKEKHKVETCH